ncbi:MAG: ABC transporter substrate-binding protein [Bacteroides sp.]|nr:ABC transporter substrate-binding protein [Bacteroides sp.]
MFLRYSRLALLILISLICCISCKKDASGKKNLTSGEGSLEEVKYAQGFTIACHTSYTRVTVYNPWKKGEIYKTYYLIKEENQEVPEDGICVRIPIKSMVANSSTYLGFLDLLEETEKITGVCNSDYIYNRNVLTNIDKGITLDVGDSYNLDMEQIILLNPDIVMTSAYEGIDENSRRMEQLGIPVVYNIEWQEADLLGRAEWIKFIGAFFDKSALSDSIFSAIERRYMEIKNNLTHSHTCPTILSGQDYRGTWYMPAGRSYNAQLFRDAKGCYYYDNDSTHEGSIPNTMEEALIHFSDADIWIGVQAHSLNELASLNSKYTLFKAFKNKNVFNYNNRVTPKGGNDYWETGIARPDLLLCDMIKILHPEALPAYELTFTKQLISD